jgi:hypothetical protein
MMKKIEVTEFKFPVLTGRMLMIHRLDGYIVKNYSVTTWFSDGTIEKTEEPAYDQEIFIPQAEYP